MIVKLFVISRGCRICEKVRDYLLENKVDFQEFDVEKDSAAYAEMIVGSDWQGVPVIRVNDKWIIGFDKDKLDEAFK